MKFLKGTRKNIGEKILVVIFVLFVLIPTTSITAQDQQGLGKPSGISYVCPGGGPCSTFAQLIDAVKQVTNFAVVSVALPFSVIVIVYAGYIYLTSGGKPDKRKEANDMFVKVLWGIFWVLGAWLVINLIMTTLTAGTGVPQLLK